MMTVTFMRFVLQAYLACANEAPCLQVLVRIAFYSIGVISANVPYGQAENRSVYVRKVFLSFGPLGRSYCGSVHRLNSRS